MTHGNKTPIMDIGIIGRNAVVSNGKDCIAEYLPIQPLIFMWLFPHNSTSWTWFLHSYILIISFKCDSCSWGGEKRVQSQYRRPWNLPYSFPWTSQKIRSQLLGLWSRLHLANCLVNLVTCPTQGAVCPMGMGTCWESLKGPLATASLNTVCLHPWKRMIRWLPPDFQQTSTCWRHPQLWCHTA